ncbi:response regulator [Brassicibacter mesophilus]|uniref:response regulator n=1 Tax=Brassicibacter mesophilus TaxID=745119 RepID=UPI003D1A035C
MKPKVLCVDDQYGMRVLLKEILKRDYDVEVVETGEEALELVKKFKPQVVLLDMKLQNMKGTDVLKLMRQIDHSISSIILTGYSEQDKLDEIEESKPELVIKKPFDIDIVRNSVRKLISESMRNEFAC